MNKMLKNHTRIRSVGLIIAIVVVIAAIGILAVLQPWKQEPIKIGAVLSITGPGSHIVNLRDGMLMAVDEVNSWGGINGRKIELIVEDNKTDIKEGVAAFGRIESIHQPVLYVSVFSSFSMALAPLAEKYKVALMALNASLSDITKQNDWVFRYFPTEKDEIPPILSILKDLNVKKLGIIYLNDNYGRSVFGFFKESFEKTGGTVRSESFEREASDFREKLQQLTDMEAIYAVGIVRHYRDIFRQLKEENYNGHILGASGASVLHLEKDVSITDGVYVAAPIIYDPKFLFVREVKEKYELKYKKPFTHHGANGYDFIKLLAGLLEDQEISRDNIKRLLEGGFIHPGIFGTLDVKPGEHDITFPFHPAQIVGGGIKYLRR